MIDVEGWVNVFRTASMQGLQARNFDEVLPLNITEFNSVQNSEATGAGFIAKVRFVTVTRVVFRANESKQK